MPRSEDISSVLYEISNAASSTEDLSQLYQKIHLALDKILDATNFFIATYDSHEDLIHFTYWVDEYTPKDTPSPVSLSERSDSISALVMLSGKPLIFKKNELIEYWNKVNCPYQEPVCEVWVGMPLIADSEVIGVIALQNYSDPDCYSEEDIAILQTISKQIAFAIDRKRSQTRYQNLLKNIKDVVYTTDFQGKLNYVGDSLMEIAGYHPREGMSLWRWSDEQKSSSMMRHYIHPDDRMAVDSVLNKAVESKAFFEVEYRFKTKFGYYKWVRERSRFFQDESGEYYLKGILTDIHQGKQDELINKALFEIVNSVNSILELPELFQRIHRALAPVLNVDHFYIGLYHQDQDLLEIVFNSDEVTDIRSNSTKNLSNSNSYVAEVINSGTPLIIHRQEDSSSDKSKFIIEGDQSCRSWIGVPLIANNSVSGVVVSRSFSSEVSFNEKDEKLLVSISDQIALAIERKRSEEQMLLKEKVISLLFRISNSMHTSKSLYQFYESVCHSLEAVIDIDSFTIALYDHSTDRLYFHYSSDSTLPLDINPLPNASKSFSLTYHVIKIGETLLLGESEKLKLQAQLGGKMVSGPSSKAWLGIPLKGKNRTLGVIVNQSYSDENHFQKADVDLLEAISDQIAFAIEYKQAETDLVSAQNELLEKAHKAGMADLAADTIHNLGNILNSVKTSNDLVNGILQDSRVAGLSKAAGLLRENSGDLSGFLKKDQNSDKLLKYLVTIENPLSVENSQIKELTDRLTEKIVLMNSVIQTQQQFVFEGASDKFGGITEVVNDILNMYEATLSQLGITVVRKFDTSVKTEVQRTRLTHILMNLIENAKDAILRWPDSDRILEVIIVKTEGSTNLTFKDSGEGLHPQDLNKIFTHGYTTKSHGHGFGLHNCASLVKEMKGKISVESDGKGKGASFIVQFPDSIELQA